MSFHKTMRRVFQTDKLVFFIMNIITFVRLDIVLCRNLYILNDTFIFALGFTGMFFRRLDRLATLGPDPVSGPAAS